MENANTTPKPPRPADMRWVAQPSAREKTGRFELTNQPRSAIDNYLRLTGRKPGQVLFCGRNPSCALTTRQNARLLKDWVASIGLDPLQFGTHSLRWTEAVLIYLQTGNLLASRLLLGHSKIAGQACARDCRRDRPARYVHPLRRSARLFPGRQLLSHSAGLSGRQQPGRTQEACDHPRAPSGLDRQPDQGEEGVDPARYLRIRRADERPNQVPYRCASLRIRRWTPARSARRPVLRRASLPSRAARATGCSPTRQ